MNKYIGLQHVEEGINETDEIRQIKGIEKFGAATHRFS